MVSTMGSGKQGLTGEAPGLCTGLQTASHLHPTKEGTASWPETSFWGASGDRPEAGLGALSALAPGSLLTHGPACSALTSLCLLDLRQSWRSRRDLSFAEFYVFGLLRVWMGQFQAYNVSKHLLGACGFLGAVVSAGTWPVPLSEGETCSYGSPGVTTADDHQPSAGNKRFSVQFLPDSSHKDLLRSPSTTAPSQGPQLSHACKLPFAV